MTTRLTVLDIYTQPELRQASDGKLIAVFEPGQSLLARQLARLWNERMETLGNSKWVGPGNMVEVHAPRIEGGRLYDEWVPVSIISAGEDGSIMAKVPGGPQRRFARDQWR